MKHPTAYLASAGTVAAIGGDELLEGDRRAFDFMLNALRLNAGFTLSMFEARTGLPRQAIASQVQQAQARGWLRSQTDAHGEPHLMPTPLGQAFTNDVIGLFLTA